MYQTALQGGLITRNSVDAVKATRDEKAAEYRDAQLAHEQIAALGEYLASNEWRRFLTFILGTAMHGGEDAGLTWDRVDFLRSRIRVDQELLCGNYGIRCIVRLKS